VPSGKNLAVGREDHLLGICHTTDGKLPLGRSIDPAAVSWSTLRNVIHFHKRVAGTFRISLSFLAPAVIGQDSTVQRYSDAGQSALAAGYYVGAERAYEKLRDLEPGIAEVHANLGLIYFEGKKFDQAVPALRQALRLKPSLVKSESLLAMSLSELGRYSEALPGLEKGFHRSSEPEIKRMCGLELERSYTALKKDSKSVEVAIELNRLYPDDPEILYQTGKVYGNFAFRDHAEAGTGCAGGCLETSCSRRGS
jgi:tetratricopeptide (TPR) repeat protein